ncbi:PLP-dependent aminotransferase family protein [Paracoccus caeni]|uniref:PLP-dependent aminotransferase family protein n=1 Tax=Paracoccus caeni TaxID=657651 RepID=A0A934VVN8_9RHOB|nr:PLP-dependent aminotransferase family protein [Paracoccus caeni]MBK4217156.1 PLP-dependent aminotransferase family protein [Paracoccus caeni]
MNAWSPDPTKLSRPAYLSLADQFTRAIADGSLAAGTQLKTQRKLAFELGLSVQTVSRSYEELIRRGLIVGEVGRGSFVRAGLAENAPPYLTERSKELIDLSILKPVSDRMHTELMRNGLHWVADNMAAASALSFRPSSVLPRHRAVAAEWLRRGGIVAAPDNIIITDGATSAITTAVMSAAPAGSTMATSALTHHLLIPLCKYLGIHLEGLASDDDGILPDALDHAAARGAVQVLYMQPSAIGPRTTMVSEKRRIEIVEIARRHDLTIIENDVLNALIVDRPPPLAALAPERVLHINGFTKITLPGLRLAYLVAPDRLSASAANRHLVTNWMATPVMVDLLSHWINDGTVDKLLDWQRAALRDRHALARDMLAGTSFRAHPQSLHIWLELPPGYDEDQFVARATQRGVAIASGRAFRVNDRNRRDAVRIALGSTHVGELRRGLQMVTELLNEEAEPLLPMI